MTRAPGSDGSLGVGIRRGLVLLLACGVLNFSAGASPSMKGPDVLGVHAEQHSLVIDLNQHHLVLQAHGVDL